MRFPKAYSGVRKIWSAEILALINALLTAVLLVLSVVALTAVQIDKSFALGTGTAAFVCLICAGVLTLVAFILKLIGIIQGIGDESAFKTALIFTIIGFVTGALTYIQKLPPRIQAIMGFVNIISQAANLAAAMYIILAIQRLAERSGRVDLVKKGNTIMKLVLLVYIFVLLANTVSSIFNLSRADTIAGGVFALVAGVLALIAYIIYLSYLLQAKKMLAE